MHDSLPKVPLFYTILALTVFRYETASFSASILIYSPVGIDKNCKIGLSIASTIYTDRKILSSIKIIDIMLNLGLIWKYQ